MPIKHHPSGHKEHTCMAFKSFFYFSQSAYVLCVTCRCLPFLDACSLFLVWRAIPISETVLMIGNWRKVESQPPTLWESSPVLNSWMGNLKLSAELSQLGSWYGKNTWRLLPTASKENWRGRWCCSFSLRSYYRCISWYELTCPHCQSSSCPVTEDGWGSFQAPICLLLLYFIIWVSSTWLPGFKAEVSPWWHWSFTVLGRPFWFPPLTCGPLSADSWHRLAWDIVVSSKLNLCVVLREHKLSICVVMGSRCLAGVVSWRTVPWDIGLTWVLCMSSVCMKLPHSFALDSLGEY